ncbi:MAG: hypothetical protein WD156_07660 [Acidimicrobiia bacterium]
MKRATFAVAEQGAWSLAGFAASVVLARLLGVEDFGLFALAMVVLNGVGALINSLVLDPAQIVGPTRFDSDLHRYGGLLLTVSLVVGLAVCGLGLILFAAAPNPSVATIAMGLVIGLPTYVSWTARRLPYLTSEPGKALAGSIIYLAATIGGLFAWNALASLTVNSALLILGLAAAVQSVLVIGVWKPTWGGARDKAMSKSARDSHWIYGRWYLAGEGSAWVLDNGFVGFSAAALGLGAAGGYRSGQVLMRPYGVVSQGLSMFFMPRYARRATTGGIAGLVPATKRIGLVLSALAAANFAVFALLGEFVMETVFGPDFAQYAYVVVIMAGLKVVHAWIVALSMALTAAEFPRDVFFGQLASGITSIVAGLTLGVAFGLAGLLAAMWIATIARGVVLYGFFRLRLNQPPEPNTIKPTS